MALEVSGLAPVARLLLSVGFAVFAVVVVVLPLSEILVSIRDIGVLYGDAGVRAIIGNTFEMAIAVTMMCVFIAFVVVALPRRRLLITHTVLVTILILPFLSDQLSRNFGWYFLLRTNGIVNAVRVHFGLNAARLLYRPPTVIAVMTQGLYPLAVLPVLFAYARIGDAVLSVGTMLGARRGFLLRHVELPLTAFGWAEGVTYVLCSALGFYITPRMLGGDAGMTLAALIDRRLNTLLDWHGAATLSVLPLLAGLAGSAVFVAMGTRRRALPGFAAVPTFSRVRSASIWLYPTVISLAVLPLLPVSMSAFGTARDISFPPVGFTFKWLRFVLSDQEWVQSWCTSLAAASLAVVLGGVAAVGGAIIAARGRAGFTLVTTLCAITLLTPPIVAAVGLYRAIVMLPIRGEMLRLAIGQAFRGFPYILLSLLVAHQSFPDDQRRAASTFAGRSLRAWVSVLRGVFAMPLLVGCALAFVVVFFDLEIAVFLSGPATVTIPMRIWAGLNYYVESAVAASALVTTIVGMLGVALAVSVARHAYGRVRR